MNSFLAANKYRRMNSFLDFQIEVLSRVLIHEV